MDVNAIQTGGPTPEEKKKLVAEGHCFTCRRQGHVSRMCPEKKKNQNKGSKPAQHPAAVWAVEEERKEITRDQLMDGLMKLSDDDKEHFIKDMVDSTELCAPGFLKSSCRATWVRALGLKRMYISYANANALNLPISFANVHKTVADVTLVDSGATENFLDQRTVR
jgi:hypothetical protein